MPRNKPDVRQAAQHYLCSITADVEHMYDHALDAVNDCYYVPNLHLEACSLVDKPIRCMSLK